MSASNDSNMATANTMMSPNQFTTIQRGLFDGPNHNNMVSHTEPGVGDPMLGARSMNSTLNQVNRGGKPYIEILEQPRSRGLRFRYKCEGRSAGTIPGQSSSNEHRTYPTIKICNHSGPSAIVVVSCVTKDDPPRPHPHSLVGKDCKQGVCTVKLKGTTTVSFPSLGIQCATKKEVQEALKQREKIRVDPWGTGYYKNVNNVELSTVRLAFQAFLPDENGKYTRIVQPTVSQCIFDKKAINDLVICRLSRQSGSVRGGDEVFLLCEKVTKDDIQIRFFEENKEEGLVWEKYGVFGQQDVHRQVAIVFKTPDYRDHNITTPITVSVQLRRPSDDEVSDPKPFQFIPNDPDPDYVVRKRKRKNINFDSFMKDYKVPPYPPMKDVPQTTKETIKERLIKKVSRNQPSRSVDQGPPSAHFPLQPYSMDNTGGEIQPNEPMSYDIMSPQQHWQASTPPQIHDHQTQVAISMAGSVPTPEGQQIMVSDGTYVGVPAEGQVLQQHDVTTAVMNSDGTISEHKTTSDIFTMLRESNNAEGGYTGGVPSMPSLPSALLDNFTGAANYQDNLAILREENVAAEETVESMNEDAQMTPVPQNQYTNMGEQ